MTTAAQRILVAVSGASGTVYAQTLLKALSACRSEGMGIETHLILSRGAVKVMEYETELSPEDLRSNATFVYEEDDIAAGPASGSWRHQGMVVCPCSMASLAAIASGLGSNLIHRAADVTLKEKRPLVLIARETPLNLIHIRNMAAAAEAGAVIMPACPGFYHNPSSVQDLVDQFIGRVLDHLGVAHGLCRRWKE